MGDLDAIMDSATGVVTVNSTAGLSAIAKGLPTIALGCAIYDIDGLAHQQGLDRFWTYPERPVPELYAAFRKVAIQRTQVSGAYARRRGVEIAVPEVTRRLLAS